jgi:peptide methionine sulfoxide reductase MsrB
MSSNKFKYTIVDDSNNDEILFQTNDKFEAECALGRFLYLGFDAYFLTIGE